MPQRAVREAIVNGVVHRDWISPDPTVVEHVGDVITVTSPGGFIGGVSPRNIITHPAQPRYRSLAEAMAHLRLAEREGIGVDRMVRDLLSLGRPEPEISSIDGPYVRVGLVGGDPDREVVDVLAATVPESTSRDVDALLLIDLAVRAGWFDQTTAAPAVQRPPREAAASIARLSQATVDGEPFVVSVAGTPADAAPAFRLGDRARARLSHRLAPLARPEGRTRLILAWARHRGRVSTTEIADLTGLSVARVGHLLTELEHEGELAPGRPTKRGRGFFYVPGDA